MAEMKFLVNKSVFRSYDIRGLVPQDMNETTAYAVARAFVRFNPARLVVVGCDHRPSTEGLRESVIEGLLDAGVDVWDIGQVTTDMAYFAAWFYGDKGGMPGAVPFAAGKPSGVEGAIMVTASHMPPQFNGFKFITKELQPIGMGSGMEELYQLAKEVKTKDRAAKRGKRIKKAILKDYLNFVWCFAEKRNSNL